MDQIDQIGKYRTLCAEKTVMEAAIKRKQEAMSAQLSVVVLDIVARGTSGWTYKQVSAELRARDVFVEPGDLLMILGRGVRQKQIELNAGGSYQMIRPGVLTQQLRTRVA